MLSYCFYKHFAKDEKLNFMKSQNKKVSKINELNWCRWPESNRHGRLTARGILSPLRLPVPPHLQKTLTGRANTQHYIPPNPIFQAQNSQYPNHKNQSTFCTSNIS